MKKIFISLFAILALGLTANAQTNFQTFYDFGRGHFTSTLEGFHQDNWGNTFFFIDYDYNNTAKRSSLRTTLISRSHAA